jgi:membrane protein required for colicin V production
VWLDLVLLAVFLVFALLGAWRGALESGLRLAGWIAGYVAAAAAAAMAGDAVAAAVGVPDWLGMPLAGTLAFFATQLLFAVAIAIARRRRDEAERGPGDRILGAAFGAARGALLALLIGWLALLGDALRSQGMLAALPPLDASLGAQWSGRVVESGTAAALGADPGARAVAALAARPRETLDSLRAVVEHPRVVELQRDSEFWLEVEAGDVERALARPSAQALTGDVELRRELASLGLVDRAAAEHPVAFERALAEALGEVSVRLAALRSDPEVRALLEDPEVLGLVERGDALGLLSHPRFRSVIARASAS